MYGRCQLRLFSLTTFNSSADFGNSNRGMSSPEKLFWKVASQEREMMTVLLKGVSQTCFVKNLTMCHVVFVYPLCTHILTNHGRVRVFVMCQIRFSSFSF